MTKPEQLESIIVESAPAAEAPPATSAKTAAKLKMLDGDEIIQLSIKPSLWFIPLVSLNVLLALTFVAVALGIAMHAGSLTTGPVPFQILAALAALRLGVATLQWASRLYVLTNRRVMRFKGVLNVEVAERRLLNIERVELDAPWYGRALRLASLRMHGSESAGSPLAWDDVARPQEIHEIIVRAIRKVQS